MKEPAPACPPTLDPDGTRSLHDALFGRLALHNGFVDQEQLGQAVRQQKISASASLADMLVQGGTLSEKSRQGIAALLEAHVARHNNDPQQSLSSLPASSTESLGRPNGDDTVAFVPQQGMGQPQNKRFGEYELLAEIARGGMGVVYKARQSKLNRLVAVKMIRSGELADDEQCKRFYAEAEAAAKLDHPGIVPVYEVGEANGQHFFSMALVVGTSLNERVKNDGPLPPQEAARLLKRVVEAVEYAHGKGIIHRDIKPQNILLDETSQPRLTDFGLAKQLLGQSDLTASGQVMGTPSYMPPEQASGKLDEIGPATDVYSLGATLYFLLTGRPPFQTASTVETIKQVLDSEPVALRRLNPTIPRDLETICLKCLRKEPAKRYATAAELAADLGNWLENKPIVARPVGPAERTWLWCKRRPALVGMSLVFLALSIVGGMMAWERHNATLASGLVAELESADIAQVPDIVARLSGYQTWAVPLLDRELADAENGSRKKLHTTLARLPQDEAHVAYLREQLLVVSPNQFPVVRDSLLPYREQLVEPLWRVALDEQQPIQPRFQAACALATYAPEDERWGQIDKVVAGHLISRQVSDLVAWQAALRPARNQLLKPLGSIYRDTAQERQYRVFATEILADFGVDQPAVFVDLLADAEQFQYPVIFDKLDPGKAIPLAAAELIKQPASDASEDGKERLAMRQANLAVALVKLGAPEHTWPLLKATPEPRVRAYFIHWLSPLGAASDAFVKRLEVEQDVSIRQALLFALGEFNETQLPPTQRQQLIPKLLAICETEPDAGLHAAAAWLLRTWGEKDRLQSVVEKLRGQPPRSVSQSWQVDSQGQTMVMLDADEFTMGSPKTEPHRTNDELLHLRKIGRRFAIAAHETTAAQFAAFQAARPEIGRTDNSKFVRTPDSPQVGMTWCEAAAYCNWLSEREGLPEDQWCYEPNAKKKYADGMRLKPDAEQLSGYRLPTEAEWEYACRAGTVTSRYYGLSEPLLPKYAQHVYVNSPDHFRTLPVGSKKPNDFGLFDMLGNVFEYTNNYFISFDEMLEVIPSPPPDPLDSMPVNNELKRTLRGGSFLHEEIASRSAMRFAISASFRFGAAGFRVAKTLPPAR